MIASPKKSYVGFVLLLAYMAIDYRFNLTMNIWELLQRQIQSSHISENTPEDSEFESYLKRDLQSFFRDRLKREDIIVESDLLRRGATQSGVAYPKFYSWVRILDTSGIILESGAVRVAAVNQSHFEVTDFLESSKIIANPDSVAAVFPKLLLEKIQTKARSEK